MDITREAGRLLSLPATAVEALRAAPHEVQQLLDDVRRLVAEAFALLDRVRTLVERAELVVAEAQVGVEHGERVVVRGAEVVEHLAVTSEAARHQLDRIRALVDVYQPMAERLSPLVEQGASTLEPTHLQSIGQLLDELPEVVQLIHPALSNLARIGPEMGDIAERMDNVGQIVEGLPGAKMLRRRGSEKEPMD